MQQNNKTIKISKKKYILNSMIKFMYVTVSMIQYEFELITSSILIIRSEEKLC